MAASPPIKRPEPEETERYVEALGEALRRLHERGSCPFIRFELLRA